MRFTVRHLTRYGYSAPVRLGPQRLRLSPRTEGVTLHSAEIAVTPAPVTRVDRTDVWGNPLTRLTFGRKTRELVIESRFTLDTHAPASPAEALPALPWGAPAPSAFLPREAVDPEVAAFAANLAAATRGRTEAFLSALNETLFTRTDRHIRLTGNAQTPAETLATAKGACRDLTMLFIAVARTQGIPARFVSGYQAQAESVDGRRHLHAWPEVLLPGQGWRGYDPTHGVPVTDGHVALCVAPGQAGTLPLEGGFRGPEVTTTLDYEVVIDTADRAAD